ncbi:MAG TPA: alpha/beta fold hydrolase [Alphaproteobacteria bacterium]|nr:alpha/beta fold hydrolase [Alphaproteobacteria bacterium]
MAMLQAHGCELEYEWVGERMPGRPTLVFLHQGLGSVALWRGFPAKLAAATGCQAFVYSREGHAGSDTCTWPRPLDFMQIEGRDRLPQVLAAAGIDEFILIGHSDGGTIALVYAAEVKTGLRGVIAEAPHVFAERATLDQIRHTRATYETDATDGTDETANEPKNETGEIPGLRAKLKRYHGRNVDSAFYGWAASWLQPGFENFSIEEMIPSIEVPVLAILGSRDEYGTMAQLDRLQKRARCPLEISSPDCGHTPHEEREQETLALMADFVARLQAPV